MKRYHKIIERGKDMSKRTRNPVISGILSLIVPGLGQLYNNKPKHFIIFISATFLIFIIAAITKFHHHFIGFIAMFMINGLILVFSILISVLTSIRNYPESKKMYNKWVVYLVVILVFVVYARILIPEFIGVKTYSIPTESMSPTIQNGDRIVVSPNYYFFSKRIKKGDVVVFSPPGDKSTYIKRCVAVAGDTVLIKNNHLYINGTAIDEKYVKGDTNYYNFENAHIDGTVPQGCIVVLGDNREHSSDSRAFGYVKADKFIGKALFIYYSKDYTRIGNTIE
jgi:signal peptidase I